MRDIKIIFDGDASTIDLNSLVEDKNLYEQKVLVNMVTENGSDKIFPSRGTKMLADSINGKVYSRTGTVHIGNFAALDTIYFIRSTDPEDIAEENYTLRDINVDGISYNSKDHALNMSVQIVYKDETTTEVVADLPTLS
jgi:biotin carboxylase